MEDCEEPPLFISGLGDVMHMSLSRGNRLQSNIGGQGNPWLSIVERHPDLTFSHNDLE